MMLANKSAVRYIRRVVDELERTRLRRSFVAVGASLYATARDRTLHVFFIDADGDWVNWQRRATFVSPQRHLQDVRTIETLVHDQWSHRYAPRPGDVVVDVGAGIGEEAVVYAKLVGASGRVVAIEAHPRTFSCLEKTIERNGLSNVTAINCAITDSAQDVYITDNTRHHLGNTIVNAKQRGVRVRGRTLDAVIAELGLDSISLLKMNIEGAEKPALSGMSETIARTRFAVISCHDFIADAGGAETTRTRAEVQAFLIRHGFDIARRPADPRPWVRDYVYGAHPGSDGSS